MSIFARRYGSNKIKCDFYIVEDTPRITDGAISNKYYMYNPDEWLKRCNALAPNGQWYPGSKFYNKCHIVAFAIVNDDYQFLFSPTVFFGETISTEFVINPSINLESISQTYHAIGTNFSPQYARLDESPNVESLINLFNSFSDDDGYSNTEKLRSLHWIDTPINVGGKELPEEIAKSLENTCNGYYLVPGQIDVVQSQYEHYESAFNLAESEINDDGVTTTDSRGNQRAVRWGIFTDKNKLPITKFYIPAKNELAELLKNLFIAIHDRKWLGYTADGPWGPGTGWIDNFVYSANYDYYGYSYFKEMQVWAVASSQMWQNNYSCWSSTPYTYIPQYESSMNAYNLNLQMYTANFAHRDLNGNDYYDSLGQVIDSTDVFSLSSKYNWGAIAFNRYKYCSVTPNYRGSWYSSAYATKKTDYFENFPNTGLIACAKIPREVEWGAESVGHPELKYN